MVSKSGFLVGLERLSLMVLREASLGCGNWRERAVEGRFLYCLKGEGLLSQSR